jgi:hypothetical protein
MAANVSTPSYGAGVCGDPTVRVSVARTRKAYGGTAVAASTVKSETKGMRVAYPGTECNIPLIP